MRKRIMPLVTGKRSGASQQGWLNLSGIAIVEVTSEQEEYPIESVFRDDAGSGWRASQPGQQVIRIVFDASTAIGRIQLRFDESRSERTQQFTLNWHPVTGGCSEIVRQQWNFSPAGSTTEIEDYEVNLDGVAALELLIKPDIRRDDAVATLSQWRVGSAR